MSDQLETPEPTYQTLWDRLLFKNNRWSPWFNLIGVTSAILGVYTWIQSEVEVDPTLIVDPQHTVLIERERLKDAPVQVIRRDGALVDRDVTGARIYFWNDGRKPLLRSDVLEPFRLSVKEPAEILDFRVTKSSRPKITQQMVERVENRNNQLSIDFRVLEHHEGLSLLLIIAGDPNAPVSIDGVAIGSPKVTTADSVATKHLWYWFLTAGRVWVFSVLFTGLLLAVVVKWRIRKRTTVTDRAKLEAELRASTTSPILHMLMIAAVTYLVLRASSLTEEHHDRILDLVPEALIDRPPRSAR